MVDTADMWVCGVCRSVNRRGIDRCYKCQTPRNVAATKVEDLDRVKPEDLLKPTGTYRSGETLATLTSIAAAAFILLTLASLFLLYQANDALFSGDVARSDALHAGPIRPLAIAAAVAGVGLLVSYGAWIRQAIANLPALGLGYSRVGPTWAFIEPLIPGVNLATIPVRMVEVAEKLGASATVMPLLGIAALLVIVPSAGAALLYRFTRVFGTGEEFLRLASLAGLIVFACLAGAIVIVLVVMWQLEARFRERGGRTSAAAEGAAAES